MQVREPGGFFVLVVPPAALALSGAFAGTVFAAAFAAFGGIFRNLTTRQERDSDETRQQWRDKVPHSWRSRFGCGLGWARHGGLS